MSQGVCIVENIQEKKTCLSLSKQLCKYGMVKSCLIPPAKCPQCCACQESLGILIPQSSGLEVDSLGLCASSWIVVKCCVIWDFILKGYEIAMCKQVGGDKAMP